MNSTSIGTCHFVSIFDAYRYYRVVGCDTAEVDRKRREGEISISLPPSVDGAAIRESGGRYFYDYSVNPTIS